MPAPEPQDHVSRESLGNSDQCDPNGQSSLYPWWASQELVSSQQYVTRLFPWGLWLLPKALIPPPGLTVLLDQRSLWYLCLSSPPHVSSLRYQLYPDGGQSEPQPTPAQVLLTCLPLPQHKPRPHPRGWAFSQEGTGQGADGGKRNLSHYP